MIRSYARYWYRTLTLHSNVDIENTPTRIDKIFCKARNIISWQNPKIRIKSHQ